MQFSRQRSDYAYKDFVLSRRISYFFWVLVVCWTLVIVVSWYWSFQAEQKVFHKVALAEARAVIERDAMFRRWSSTHGGVYVPATPQSPPSPYLSHIPERDILTPSGKQLTLINPAYMIRQMNELVHEGSIFLGRAHLTSLNPLRPENKSDKWEADISLNHSIEERIKQTVADLRHKDQSLIQQGRLAAMGEMINNIAHQWRQPLNNIGLIIQSIQLSYEDGTITHDEMEQEIGKAMDVIMHMSGTIDDFRNFFRKDKEKTLFLIGKTIHRTLEFISASLASHNVLINFEDDESVTVTGYQNEYAQVLLNIISNVRETCIERNIASPCITIRITTEHNRSAVYIRDNCGGIADDIMPRIFDPYFTTRAPDKGTGIGLYMSKVIIEQNMNGSLTDRNSQGGRNSG